MDNHEFEDLGKKIQDIVDNAVNSNSYHELSHTISQTVNKAIDSGSEALKNAMNSVFDPGADPEFRKKSYTYQSPYYGRSRKAKQQAARKQTELLYGKTTGENLKGMMMAVSGGILLSGMGLGAMVLLIWMGIGHSGALAAGVLGVMCAGAAGGGALWEQEQAASEDWDVSRSISVRWEITPTVIFRSLPRQQERTRNL